MSIRDSLGALRSAFRDELAGVRAGLTDEGAATGLDRLATTQSFERTGAAPGMGDYLGQRLGGFGQAPSGLDRLGTAAQWSLQERAATDPWAGFEQRRRFAQGLKSDEDAERERARQASRPQSVYGPAEPGEGFGTPEDWRVEQQLGARGVPSPLQGRGAWLKQIADREGVPVAVVLAIMNQESGYGTDQNQLTTANNYFGLTGTGDRGSVMVNGRQFAAFSSPEAGTEAAVRNMAGAQYRNLPLQQYLALYLTGNPNGADDGSGNTTASYVNNAQGVIRNMGGNAGAGNVVVRSRAAGGGAGGTFPVAGYSGGPLPLHWGEDSGAADIFAPAGSGVVAFLGGQVTSAGWSDIGGWNISIYDPQSGLTTYYAHLASQPLVRQGQQVTAGTALGAVGNTGNASSGPAHLHFSVGEQILSGSGARGGAGAYRDGRPYDTVGWLNRLLGGGGRTAAAATPTTRPATTGRPVRY